MDILSTSEPFVCVSKSSCHDLNGALEKKFEQALFLQSNQPFDMNSVVWS